MLHGATLKFSNFSSYFLWAVGGPIEGLLSLRKPKLYIMEYHISFWNLENLFDIEGSPRRSEKLERPIGSDLVGWDQVNLDNKIGQLSAIIQMLNSGKGPDVLGVCEVENKHVLELLVDLSLI